MRIIIVGGGEVVFFLARTFLSKGYQVSVINKSMKKCEQLAKSLKVLVINGDGSNPQYLEDALAREAELLIAVTPFDHVNLVCCQTGSMIFGIPSTLALVNDPDNYEIFKNFGIQHVFNQTELIASMLEKNVEYDNLNHLLSYADEQVLFNEVRLTDKMPASGKTLREIVLPEKVRIIGVTRKGKFIFVNMDFRFEPNDLMLILTTPESHGPAVRAVCGKEA